MSFRLPGSPDLQLLELLLTPVVLGELLDESLPEHLEGRDQRVELVQRVRAATLRPDLELQAGAENAVANELDDRLRPSWWSARSGHCG
jgi:hypothetical protein